MAIESLATLDLPMVIDSIGIFEMKGPYCMLTMTNWFLQELSMIPMGSWGDVARCFIMIRWVSPKMCFRSHKEFLLPLSPPPLATAVACCQTPFRPYWQGESVRDNSLCFLVQGSEGIWKLVMDRIRRTIGDSTVEVLSPRKTGIVGAGHEVAEDKYF
ncbi:tetratricopeptide repeat protein 7A [Dorcoceras hygrometricum]|uniref:Tetratricopeptide repeat protein 7A n=1 Tax=Dorcoceras hygrometricum TaxID=472368 RepID=A0A2Z7A3Z8_9LAMI|nr:tetratricopeptide repeat protein 7A [Dorcoceras hygrometricum]